MRSARAGLGILLIVAAVVIAGVTLANALIYDSSDPEIAIPATASVANAAAVSPEEYPARIRIPRIRVDAVVGHVGIGGGGRMAPPKKFSDAAWFKYGTVPGRQGSAVIGGHRNNGLGLNGVFRHLDDLSVGDEIIVQKKDGTELAFEVFKIESYRLDQVPGSVFTKTDGVYMNLISCVGKWVNTPDLGWTYDRRLVVYTKLKS